MIGGIACVGQRGEDGAPLLPQRGDGGQQALHKAAASRRLGPAAPFAPEHRRADRPLGHVVGRFDAWHPDEGPQGGLDRQERAAGLGGLGVVAGRPLPQQGGDLLLDWGAGAGQVGVGQRAGAPPGDQGEEVVHLGQQRRPQPGRVAAPLGDSGEVALEVRPAHLAAGGAQPGVARPAIGPGTPREPVAQQRPRRLAAPTALHEEEGHPGAHRHPEPRFPIGLAPARLVHVDLRLGLDVGVRRGHRPRERGAGGLLQGRDGAQAEVHPEQRRQHLLHLAVTQRIAPAQQADAGVQARPEGPGRHAGRQRGSRDVTAGWAGEAMDLVFDRHRARRGALGHLMAQWARVVPVQGVGAVRALGRADARDPVHLLQRLQGATRADMAGLPAGRAATAGTRRAGRDTRRVARWRARRVVRVLPRLRLQLPHPLLERRQSRQQQRDQLPYRRRCLIPIAGANGGERPLHVQDRTIAEFAALVDPSSSRGFPYHPLNGYTGGRSWRNMKFGLYIDPAFQSSAGIELYTRELARGVMESGMADQFIFITSDQAQTERLIASLTACQTGARAMARPSVATCRISPRLLRLTWSLVGIPSAERIVGEKMAMIHTPFNIRVPTTHCPLLVTIHDIFPTRYPSLQTLRDRISLTRRKEAASIQHAAHIIADSQNTKHDVCELFDITPDKVTVISLGVNHAMFKPITDTDLGEQILSKYGIDKQFVLYVGSLYPRKIGRLLEAFKIARAMLSEPCKLVIVGGRENVRGTEPTLRQRIQELGLVDSVIPTGIIPKDEIPVLMSFAEVFIYVSYYEGFGLSPLEAMACGAPVIVSNTSSLPEVVGDAGLLVDPSNERDIASAMARVITEPHLRERLSRNSMRRSQLFSWERTRLETFAVYRRMANLGT